MSDDTPARWFEAGQPSLPLGDRLLWLSLTLAVVTSGVWQIAQHDYWKDDTQIAAAAHPKFARAKARPAVDYTPTASIRRRAQ